MATTKPTTKKNDYTTINGGLLVLYIVIALTALGYLGIAFMALDTISEISAVVDQREFDISLRYAIFNAVVAALLAGLGAWFLTLLGNLKRLARPVGFSFITLSFLYSILEYDWYQDLVASVPELTNSFTTGTLSLPLLICLIYLLGAERVEKTLVK